MTELNRSPGSGPRIVSFDLMSDDPDYYFVLTTALGDFAAQARSEAKEGTNPEPNTRWAEVAEDALWRIEAALAGGPASGQPEAASGWSTHMVRVKTTTTAGNQRQEGKTV